MSYRKKLIEVALPLAAINAASAKEKSIRHGHPSTLHLWWARRPLAACRAVLFASLVDDPDSDPMFAGDEDLAASKRAELFNLIEELVLWENSNNQRVINKARAEIARSVAVGKIADGIWKKDTVVAAGTRAHDIKHMLAKPEDVNAFLAEHAPPVLDPFCGGGSIPLEAQRLGLRAFASDLNPVPVLITKSLIEIPPKFAGRPPVNPGWQKKSKEEKAATVWSGAHGLAADVHYYGQWMRDEAEKRIGHLYPKVKVTAAMAKERPDLKESLGEELTVIAWLWARTVASPNPVAQGAHVPIVSSLMLSTKDGKQAWVEVTRDSAAPNGWRFDVRSGSLSKDLEAKAKSGTRAGKAKDFICALTETPITRSYIQDEGKAGRLAVKLMAIVCERKRGRIYLPADENSESVALFASKLDMVKHSRESFLAGLIPTRAMITGGVCSAYGLFTWGHLFTSRQIVALTTLSDLVQSARQQIIDDTAKAKDRADEKNLADGGVGTQAYADALAVYLAFALDKCCDYWSSITTWAAGGGFIRGTFARQALPMTWDFCECNPFSSSTANWSGATAWVELAIRAWMAGYEGTAKQLDATASINGVSGPVISTDPPYYDNISYAELSDFFYIWLRRSLVNVFPSLFATVLTPKKQELIATPYRHDGSKERAQAFFEEGLGSAFAQMRVVQAADYPLTVYYAFKQAETDDSDEDESGNGAATASTGWETMLEGLIRSGFSIHGTWPMRTERGARSVGIGTNALASSVILVCRPSSTDAPLATRKQFITALRQELPDALRNLQHGNIAPVDLAQAAIGPGMSIFTRYAKVMETDGSAMSVRMALGLINQSLDEVLAEQEGEFDGETRWALAWFEQFGMGEGAFGVAETLSKAKNTAVNGLVEAGVVKARAGKVQLVGRGELPDNWDPVADERLTAWETTQHLIRALDQQGESGAATLVGRLGGMAEVARNLGYRLYHICERNKWADEALAYNGLVIAWPELTKLALAERSRAGAAQQKMFE